MKIRPLAFEGAYEITPEIRGDGRGVFMEWFRYDHLAAEIGHPFQLQ